MKGSADEFVPSGFFALRTPLLPFDEFLDWSEGLEAEADEASAADVPVAAKDDSAAGQRLNIATVVLAVVAPLAVAATTAMLLVTN